MRQCKSIVNNFTPDMGLFFVLVGDEEMLLIGREADVRERLQYGTGNILAERHQTSGKWLNDLYELRDANWLTSIDSLYHAALGLYRCRKNQKTSINESNAAAEEQRVWQEFLKDKIASGHPVNQYIALRIWNSYKNVKDARTRKCLDDFRMKARNLVRPLCGINEIEVERGLHITEKTALWDWGTPILEEDQICHVATLDKDVECAYVAIDPDNHTFENGICSGCNAEENPTPEQPVNAIKLKLDAFEDGAVVWVDGVQYTVDQKSEHGFVELPEDMVPMNMVEYEFHVGDADDVHTQYPVSMKVWKLKKLEDGYYHPEQIIELDNILQYSGSSIRVTGNKGIRMITSIEADKKAALISNGLAGYKLVEYGTVLALSSELEGDKPLTLGQSYARSNYAYKRGVADPVFAYSGNLVQYTNVLVGFSMEQCKEDIAMRSYMILEDAAGNQMTIYGGTVYRSIGYIAYQNRNVFAAGSDAYKYVWEIIHSVYGNKYDAEYKK